MTTDSLRREVPGMGSTLATRQRFALLALLFILIAFSEWLFWLGRTFERTPWWISLLFLVFAIAAAAKCFQTRARLTGSEQRAWTFFALGSLGYGVAEITWAAYDLLFGITVPSPSVADIGYFASPICYIIGIWHYRARASSIDDNFVRIGNLGIILSATLFVYLFMYAEFLRTAMSASSAFVTVAYAVVDLSAPLFGLIVISLHAWGRQHRVLLLILLGLCCTASTDFTYISALMGTGYQSASLMNGLYLLSPSFIIWAAFEQDQLAKMEGEYTVDDSSTELEPESTRWATLLPPLAVAGVLALALAFHDRVTGELISFAVVASFVFVGSLAMRNWWGHKLEVRLRTEALRSKSEMQLAYRELSEEMKFRTQAQKELRQAQKMDALGQLTGGIAHDFNNLLAVIIGNLELLESGVPMAPQQAKSLRDATSAAERGASLTQRLLALARKQALRAEPIEVGLLLGDTKNLLARTLGERIQVTISGQKNAGFCLADRAQLENAILNLAINARDAMPDGGEIEIKVAKIDLDELYAAEHPDARAGAFVAFSIQDSGMGISAEDMPRVFEPFFTTKEVGSGTGLGLSMVYGFAKQSGGHVTIESRVGSGTRVTLYIPYAEAQVGSAEAESRPDAPRGSGESILLVEDEPAVRTLVSNVLKGLGYQVTEAQNADEALALLEGMGALDLLLSDVVLPGNLSGRSLAITVAQQRPRTKILLMSGYAPDVLDERGASGRAPELLHKPFGKAELARRIRSVLDTRKPHTRRTKTKLSSNSRSGDSLAD
jgi:signal transduction histidine kinase/CheY-like chemotaxis protein